MSTTDPALPSLDPSVGLMFVAADHLIPLFRAGSIDTSLARQMAVSAIDAYQPESRADYVNVARTIAFSMAALALLGQAASQDMTMKDKMRTLGRANALNRSADQSERTMMQRRRYQQASPQAEQPHLAANPSHPGNSTPQAGAVQADEAEISGAIAAAMREYLAACSPAATEPAPIQSQARPPEAAPDTTWSKPPASDMPKAPGTPAASPIHHTAPNARPVQAPFKQELLHHSALQRVAEPSALQRAAEPSALQRAAEQTAPRHPA